MITLISTASLQANLLQNNTLDEMFESILTYFKYTLFPKFWK